MTSEIVPFQPPPDALETLPDTDRYRCRFTIRSSSSNKAYMVSFDMAMACWKCSCRGCIRHGQCRHLDAMGLSGRKHGKDLAMKKKFELA